MAAKEILPTADPSDFVIVGLDTPEDETSVYHDERALEPLEETFIRNVHYHGVLQPVTVREDGGQLIIVDGRQRVRAAREVKSRQESSGESPIRVPYTTHGTTGKSNRDIAGLIISYNEQRKEDNILNKAEKAARLLAMGYDKDEAALQFGCSGQTIDNWLRVRESHTDVQEAIRMNKLTTSGAYALSRLPQLDQVTILKELLKVTDRVNEQQIRIYLQQKEDEAKRQAEAAKTNPGTDDGGNDATDGNTDGQVAAGNDDGADVQPGDALPTNAAPQAPSPGKSKSQAGINRSWLRKALDTDAVDRFLEPDQKRCLQWISTGIIVDEGDWFAEFAREAQAEMDAEAAKKARKKSRNN